MKDWNEIYPHIKHLVDKPDNRNTALWVQGMTKTLLVVDKLKEVYGDPTEDGHMLACIRWKLKDLGLTICITKPHYDGELEMVSITVWRFR